MLKLVDTNGLEVTLAKFAAERGWERVDSPKNLVMALTAEVGELVEIFQWLSDDQANNVMNDTATGSHVKQEVADVMIYLVRLASVLQIDLNSAVIDKLAHNAIKYPAASRGTT